jgi:hypothetical protein
MEVKTFEILVGVNGWVIVGKCTFEDGSVMFFKIAS